MVGKISMAWMRLAYKEFLLPFYYWKRGGCPGGRDFVWLTILISMILTFTFLLLGSYRSILNQFVDVLIGKIEGHGVPVLVIANPFAKGGVNLINTTVLCDAEKLGNEIHPYRSITMGFDPNIELPEKSIWKIDSPGFDGWAVYRDNPLWKGVSSQDKPLPLEIVVNRTMFRKYFDYNKYREVLRKSISSDEWNKLPDRLPDTDEPMDELWLRIRTGSGSELLPFKIIWADHLSAQEKIAFLFPLSTYHALSFSNRYPELRYFPDEYGIAGERIKQIMVEGPSNGKYIKEILSRLKGEAATFRGDILISFRSPISKSQIDSIVERYHSKYQVMDSIKVDKIVHDDKGCKRRIWLPLERLPEDIVARKDTAKCHRGESCLVPIDVTAKGNGFGRAIIYVSDRTMLSTAVDKILKVNDNAFLLDPVYQDALNRFGFLSRMVESMREPYAIILGIFLFALLGIHITTIIGHRRHRYGMLLSKGMDWWKIYLMLFLQILMALCVGMVMSVLILYQTARYLQNSVASVAAIYRETLNILDFDLLPLVYIDYILLAAGILITAWLFASIALFILPLRPGTPPFLLFQE